MRKRWWLLIACGIMLSGCDLGVSRSGIEIISYPPAKVFIDGKEAGMTPYTNKSLKPGEMEVKLLVNGLEWKKKLHLENGANTVINREFGKDSESSGGYILYFESTGDAKKAGLLLSSQPGRATVKIDDEVKGLSPLIIDDVSEGDKKLSISYPGYKSLSTFVKFINGYQLVTESQLAKEEVVISPIDTTMTSTPISSGSSEMAVATVIINATETGWLRVRATADASGVEVARINPKEKYTLLEEKNGWMKIDLGSGKNGWISAKYATKSTTN